MNIDPLLAIGLIMLGMAMGAMLSHFRFKADTVRGASGENMPTDEPLNAARLPEPLNLKPL